MLVAPHPVEDAALSDLNYNRDKVIRHNRTAWIVISVVVATIVVAGFYLYSPGADMSSAVRNESPQAVDR
jgi:hypothetical protein